MNPEAQSTPQHEPRLFDSAMGRVLAATVITAEVTPLNEAIRGALAVGAGVISRDPLITAGVFGASTMVIEGGAALVTAEALDSRHGKNLIEKVDGKLSGVVKHENIRTNSAVDFSIGMLGGSAVSMLIKQAQDPERTKEQNRAFGMKLTAGVSAVCAVQGYAVAEGIESPGVDTIAAAALAVGGVFAAAKMAMNRINRRK